MRTGHLSRKSPHKMGIEMWELQSLGTSCHQAESEKEKLMAANGYMFSGGSNMSSCHRTICCLSCYIFLWSSGLISFIPSKFITWVTVSFFTIIPAIIWGDLKIPIDHLSPELPPEYLNVISASLLLQSCFGPGNHHSCQCY